MTILFYAARDISFRGEPARSMTLARFLRLFSRHGGSLSSPASGAPLRGRSAAHGLDPFEGGRLIQLAPLSCHKHKKIIFLSAWETTPTSMAWAPESVLSAGLLGPGKILFNER